MGTWLETLVASREELAKEEKNNQNRFEPLLGPWSVTGPWISEAGKSFDQKFPPEENADPSVTIRRPHLGAETRLERRRCHQPPQHEQHLDVSFPDDHVGSRHNDQRIFWQRRRHQGVA